VTIERILTERRSRIISRWLEVASAGYPDQPRGGSRSESDQFSNPVKWIIRDALEDIVDNLCGSSPVTDSPPLDRLMRLKALSSPDVSEAVAFLGALRPLVVEESGSNKLGPEDMSRIEARIDAVTKLASDRFQAARQHLTELRRREVARRTAKLVERLQRTRGEREIEPWQQ
jgi:hypothetical protein